MASVTLCWAFLLVSLAASVRCSSLPRTSTATNTSTGFFNWTSIQPSKQLNWVPCYEQKECARLEVPMDPSDASLNDTVALAILRSPAQVPRTDPRYGGSILTNPGGPGGSGVGILRWGSYEMQSKIAGPLYFDLVSWDPRGVGDTTPLPQCFDNDLQRQQYWLKQEVIGGINTSPYALQYGFAAAEAFGQGCNSTIVRYMTTLLTVQDMVAIADALEPNVKDPLINFWGMSYGTFVGNTFASVYPHRVGKMVLDGVLGTTDSLSSAWHMGLVNTSAIYDYFFQTCYNAGPTKCAIWENSTSLIRSNVEALLDQLRSDPIAIYDVPNHRADVLTAQPVEQLIFQSLYFPPQQFPGLAQALHGLMQSPPNTTVAAASIFTLSDPKDPPATVVIKPSNNSWSNPLVPPPLIDNYDTERITSCTDGNPINNWTAADATAYLSLVSSLFPLAAYVWPRTTQNCMRWPSSKRAPEQLRFTGPFGSNLSSYNTSRGARPILFIGNVADAVCPLQEAQQESAKHEGSVVLQTQIYGHQSNVLNSNACVWANLRQYWNNGTLPTEGTICPRDPWAWDPNP